MNYCTVWDCAGCGKGVGPLYYVNASACIIMFDLGSRTSHKDVPYWYKEFERVCPEAPVVVVGNKIDDKEGRIKKEMVRYPRKMGLPYYETSNKTGENITKPFLFLARTLIGDRSLNFVNRLAPQPLELSSEEEDSSVREKTDKT